MFTDAFRCFPGKREPVNHWAASFRLKRLGGALKNQKSGG